MWPDKIYKRFYGKDGVRPYPDTFNDAKLRHTRKVLERIRRESLPG